MTSKSTIVTKIVQIKTLRHAATGMIVAVSDDMKGLYVHGHSEAEIAERLPVAIRSMLEAAGHSVVSVADVTDPDELVGGFTPSIRKFDARLSTEKRVA